MIEKKSYRQHYLHVKSGHPEFFKDLPYSQVVRIKRISSNQVDLNNSPKEMKAMYIKGK